MLENSDINIIELRNWLPTEEQKAKEQETQNIIDEINNMKEQNPELEAVYNKYLNNHPSTILREMKAYEEIKGEKNQDLESLMEVSLDAWYCRPSDIVQDKESYKKILNFDDVEWKKMVQFFLGIWSKASDCVEDYEFFIELKNSPESSLKNLQLAYIRNYEHNNTNDSKSRPSDLLSSELFEKIIAFWEEAVKYAQEIIDNRRSLHYFDVYTEVAMKIL